MLNCFLVGIGGFVGSVCRYLIGLLPVNTNGGFPMKTLAINVAGCFVIGVIAALATRDRIHPRTALMLKVGFCGGFTTLSALALEAEDMIKSGNMSVAFVYVCLSVILCISAVFAAQIVVK